MGEALIALGTYKDGVAVLQSLLTMLAILLGGAWAYFKFVQGRVFVTRLEPTIAGQIVREGDAQLVVITLSIKNVGLARVNLDRAHSSIELFGYPPANYFPEFHNALLDRLGVTIAITAHDWIEPGECIWEQRLIALPSAPTLALKLNLTILQAKRITWFPGVQWNAVAIVAPEPVDPAPAAAAPPPAPARKRRP